MNSQELPGNVYHTLALLLQKEFRHKLTTMQESCQLEEEGEEVTKEELLQAFEETIEFLYGIE